MTPVEKAKEYAEPFLGLGHKAMAEVTEKAYLAGYRAALESDEVKGLVEALCKTDSCLIDLVWPSLNTVAPDPKLIIKFALTEFEKARLKL